MLSKEASSTIFKVFGMTRPGIEPRSPGPLANTLTARPMSEIYIYIYIYIYPQTNCFVVSQVFSVARLARCFKLGLKPSWLYINQISYPRAIIILSVSKGIFYIYNFYIYTVSYWSAPCSHIKWNLQNDFKLWQRLLAFVMY